MTSMPNAAQERIRLADDALVDARHAATAELSAYFLAQAQVYATQAVALATLARQENQ